MKVLIPVDGSELSLDAVRYALGLRRQGLNAEFVLANVQEPASLYELLRAHDAEVLERVSAGAGATALEVARALLDQAEVAYESEVCSGDPAHTIVDLVDRFGCDAVIMGARGTGTRRSAAMGSVAHEVLHAAQVPVTIVKDEPAEAASESAGSAEAAAEPLPE